MDGHKVIVKVHEETKETIISVPPQIGHYFSEGGKIRKMYSKFADLALGEFLIKMFSDGQ